MIQGDAERIRRGDKAAASARVAFVSDKAMGLKPVKSVKSVKTHSIVKRDQILEGALKVFLEQGYHGSSMDAIAAAARVSKPTVYNLIGNKEALFEQILLRATNDILLPIRQKPLPDIPFETEIYQFAAHYAEVLLSGPMLSLHRLAVGESERFPRLGCMFYLAGPEKVLQGMSNYLSRLASRGHLSIVDPVRAGHHFYGLVINPARNHLLFFGNDALNFEEIDDIIRSGLDAFLRAYRPARQSNDDEV